GAILYELLTGRPPFRAETPLDTVLQVLSEEPVAPSRLQAKVPRDLETICLKCLEKDPRKRYGSAAALAEDVRRFLDGERIQARPVSQPERLWRWCRRNPVVAGLLLAVAATLVLGMGATSFFAIRAQVQKQEAEVQKQEAEVQKQEAEVQKQEAERQR